jgi:hypothetical protein
VFVLPLVTLAHAHSPHDIVRALAIVDGELVSGEEIRLVRSSDSGDTLLHLDSPAGSPTCLAPLVGEPHAFLLVTDDGGAWRSVDSGATWSVLPDLRATACAPGLSGALLATRGGVLRVTSAGEAPVVAGSTTMRAVAEAAWGALVGVSEAGEFAEAEDGRWAVGEAADYATVVAGDGVLLRGSPAGIEVDEGDGAWRFVSDLAAATLGATPAAWMAATLSDGVWLSRDRGLGWSRVSDGLEPPATGGGGPREGEPHWFVFLAEGETLWAGAWEGLFRLRPGDTAWTEIELRGQPMTRDLAWIGDELLVGQNGGGLVRGTPGVDDWFDAAPALEWPWLRAIVPTEAGRGRWYFSGGVRLYASDDEGATVTTVESGLADDGDCIAVADGFPADPHAWAGGTIEGGEGAISETVDGGASWTPIPLEGCTSKPAALSAAPGGAWAACGQGVWFGGDGVFVRVATLDERVTTLLAAGEGALAGNPDGLYALVPGAEPEPLWTEGRVEVLAEEPDGAVLAATSLGLVRFRDGTEEARLGWPVGDVILSLSVRDDGRIAAGGYSGVWVSDDGGEGFESATDWDRFDDRDTAFFWTGGWKSVDDESAKTGRAHESKQVGDQVRWRVSGTQARLLGRGQGRLTVEVDGEPDATVDVARDRFGPLWGRELDGGWHEVWVTVEEGTVTLDGGERWRATTGHPVADPDPAPEGCACAAGSAAPAAFPAGLLGLLAVLVSRRPGAAGGPGAPRVR